MLTKSGQSLNTETPAISQTKSDDRQTTEWCRGTALNLGSRGSRFKYERRVYYDIFANIYHQWVVPYVCTHFLFQLLIIVNLGHQVNLAPLSGSLYYCAKPMHYVKFMWCFVFYYTYCPAWQMSLDDLLCHLVSRHNHVSQRRLYVTWQDILCLKNSTWKLQRGYSLCTSWYQQCSMIHVVTWLPFTICDTVTLKQQNTDVQKQKQAVSLSYWPEVPRRLLGKWAGSTRHSLRHGDDVEAYTERPTTQLPQQSQVH